MLHTKNCYRHKNTNIIRLRTNSCCVLCYLVRRSGLQITRWCLNINLWKYCGEGHHLQIWCIQLSRVAESLFPKRPTSLPFHVALQWQTQQQVGISGLVRAMSTQPQKIFSSAYLIENSLHNDNRVPHQAIRATLRTPDIQYRLDSW